jgi:hypothetical protein
MIKFQLPSEYEGQIVVRMSVTWSDDKARSFKIYNGDG